MSWVSCIRCPSQNELRNTTLPIILIILRSSSEIDNTVVFNLCESFTIQGLTQFESRMALTKEIDLSQIDDFVAVPT